MQKKIKVKQKKDKKDLKSVDEIANEMTAEQYLEDEQISEDKTEDNKKLMNLAVKIQNPIISANQIVSLISNTPDKYKYDRPAKGGGKWTYVSGGYVKKRLNQIFGWNWSFQILDKFKEGGEVIVQGRLLIRGAKGVEVIKEDFGKKEIQFMKNAPDKPVSIGNDYKSASTDCLKRCAYQLGLASDVYSPKEYKQLENPSDIIVYDDTIGEGEFIVNCSVCQKRFTTDKKFIKECPDCATLDKDKKSEIIKKRKDDETKKEKKLNGQPF